MRTKIVNTRSARARTPIIITTQYTHATHSCLSLDGVLATGRASVAEGLFVEVVLPVAGSHPLQVGDVVAQLLDALDLLVEELAFDEISHLLTET